MIIIKKYYPVCLESFVPCIIQDYEVYKQYLRNIIHALEKFHETLLKFDIQHGNLKLSNIFLRCSNEQVGPELSLIMSDPHQQFMFEEPKPDTEAIADIVHTLICGRPPNKVPDYKRLIHPGVKNSIYYPYVKALYELADGLSSSPPIKASTNILK